jgi:hypothetical protein
LAVSVIERNWLKLNDTEKTKILFFVWIQEYAKKVMMHEKNEVLFNKGA